MAMREQALDTVGTQMKDMELRPIELQSGSSDLTNRADG